MMMFVDVSVIFYRRYLLRLRSENTQHADSKHGQIFDDYMKYKRYYTETKSPSQKDEMDAKANEYVGETVSSIRDIWRDADPEMRRKLKAEFVKLANEMNI